MTRKKITAGDFIRYNLAVLFDDLYEAGWLLHRWWTRRRAKRS